MVFLGIRGREAKKTLITNSWYCMYSITQNDTKHINYSVKIVIHQFKWDIKYHEELII